MILTGTDNIRDVEAFPKNLQATDPMSHAASGDPADIKGKLTVADCQGCHNDSRVRAFGYKPLLRGGAH